mmetsp:Transcript_56973/g.149645  ORF Transcript_56973/g.149645 Transcript_56973/m.149645 type:complete len:261 (-) Transcript_56973:293-1075(-)
MASARAIASSRSPTGVMPSPSPASGGGGATGASAAAVQSWWRAGTVGISAHASMAPSEAKTSVVSFTRPAHQWLTSSAAPTGPCCSRAPSTKKKSGSPHAAAAARSASRASRRASASASNCCSCVVAAEASSRSMARPCTSTSEASTVRSCHWRSCSPRKVWHSTSQPTTRPASAPPKRTPRTRKGVRQRARVEKSKSLAGWNSQKGVAGGTPSAVATRRPRARRACSSRLEGERRARPGTSARRTPCSSRVAFLMVITM